VIEQSGVYKGKYFVLSGYLSPIDGIGAKELGLDELEVLLTNKSTHLLYNVSVLSDTSPSWKKHITQK
jgi:recombinational DNA repair protein RecR